MTTVLSLHSLSKAYGSQELFFDISFAISEGDRIGLVGPNGSGKSTLLKILVGMEFEDEGEISRRQGLKVGYARQSPDFPADSLENILLFGVPPEKRDEWEIRARTLLGKAQFSDPHQDASTLSGGNKKRLEIIRAMMNEPHLLLLDEPTNHLDLEGILWLEKFLLRDVRSFLIVSHDRRFLQNVTNKVIELNSCYPEGIFICDGGMRDFAERKESFLEAQAERERSLSSTVREEMKWLKRSPKARTTKSKSRVDKTLQLAEELSFLHKRNQKSKVALAFTGAERETRNLIVAKNLTKSFAGKILFRGIDLKLSPGTRLGIVGKNGSGKTTLLKILAGIEKQDLGTVKYAQDLRIVYFDQHRETLPLHVTLKEALSPSGDFVQYRGQSIHVNGWAKKFLFSADRLNLPLHCLSGGERARILLARLMLEPADVLFLDEPTNDLDIPTLEVIEESLFEFPGAVVLITHDRCLMDKVCNQILGLGVEQESQIFSDYSQWERASLLSSKKENVQTKMPAAPLPVKKQHKLSYLEQKELDGMEEKILEVENQMAELQKVLYEQGPTEQLDLYRQLAELQAKQEFLFERWQTLLNKTIPVVMDKD